MVDTATAYFECELVVLQIKSNHVNIISHESIINYCIYSIYRLFVFFVIFVNSIVVWSFLYFMIICFLNLYKNNKLSGISSQKQIYNYTLFII